MSYEVFGGAAAPTTEPLLDRLRLVTAGSYDVAGELGRGGVAVVLLDKNLELDRVVATKVLGPGLA